MFRKEIIDGDSSDSPCIELPVRLNIVPLKALSD